VKLRLLSGVPIFVLGLGASPVRATLPDVVGYYQNVPVVSESSELVDATSGDLQRLRLSALPAVGGVRFEIAWEQLLAYRGSDEEGSAVLGLGDPSTGRGEWLDLQGTIAESDRWSWRHRLDRLSARLGLGGSAEVTVGRQTVSWATTLILTPADPFVPFDPADPFREFRAGVDAIRAQAFPGPLSDLDLVVRPADGPDGETITVLGRARTVWRTWELSGWTGALHDDPAAAGGAAGAVGDWAVRAEVALRDADDDLVVRGAVGLDRRFELADRDLYLVVEYQHDDFGAARASELDDIVRSDPFRRGEMQGLGRDEIAAQVTWEAHPLLAGSLLALGNPDDGSVLLAPGLEYSAADEITLQAGVFVGLGDDDPVGEKLPSEHGIVPTTFWVSAAAFF
jgi:hypothetical protein